VTVCGAVSLFCQVIVVPFFTVIVPGLKAKLAIVADTAAGAGAEVGGVGWGAGAGGVVCAVGFAGAVCVGAVCVFCAL